MNRNWTKRSVNYFFGSVNHRFMVNWSGVETRVGDPELPKSHLNVESRYWLSVMPRVAGRVAGRVESPSTWETHDAWGCSCSALARHLGRHDHRLGQWRDGDANAGLGDAATSRVAEVVGSHRLWLQCPRANTSIGLGNDDAAMQRAAKVVRVAGVIGRVDGHRCGLRRQGQGQGQGQGRKLGRTRAGRSKKLKDYIYIYTHTPVGAINRWFRLGQIGPELKLMYPVEKPPVYRTVQFG